MEINITLILQMMQFSCAYYFLYTFVFIPAYTLLDEKQQFKDALYKNLEKEQQIKETLLQELCIKNDDFKNILIQAFPEKATQCSYQKSTFGNTLYEISTIDFSEEDRKKTEDFLINHLAQVVKK